MRTTEVTNGQNVIDSRDVIARIEDLEGQDERDEEETAELKTLKELEEEASGCADWKYGETLIRESHFEDYARELAEDIGALEGCDKWPANCIDWERAARKLQMDYSSVEFDGITYYIRS